jgi:hypothetical protein
MVRRRWWHALVEVPSLWFGLQLFELVVAFGLLPILAPNGWARWEKLASALVVYVLLTLFNYGLIQRSEPRAARSAANPATQISRRPSRAAAERRPPARVSSRTSESG